MVGTSEAPEPADGRVLVEAVLRASRLLDCFEPGRPEMPLAEFVRRAGYSKTTTYRLLTTLTAAGWLERTAGGFRLTIKPYMLGAILVHDLELRREAVPIMSELAASLDLAMYLTIPRQGRAVCVERIDVGNAVRIMDLDVGGSQALHLGAGPRVLLAFHQDELLGPLLAGGLERRTDATIADPDELLADLARTRRRGFAVSRGDVTPGIGAIGAPVFDSAGVVVGAISVGGLVEQLAPPSEAAIADTVMAACRRLSTRLGYRG